MKKLQSQKEIKKSSRNNDPYAHIPNKYKKGHCYSNAFNYLMEQKDPAFRLVHGWVTGQAKAIKGIRYSHAWIEHIEHRLVIDPSMRLDNPVVMPDFIYYFAGQIEPTRLVKYTKKEALEYALKTRKYGPWDTTFDEFPKV